MFDSGAVAEFVRNWGYLAVFIGSIFEGEIVLITASASAAFGFLSIHKVFFVAFTTTVIVDQLLFFVGYKLGTDWAIRRFPKVAAARDRVFSLLHRMDIFFIFAFRFIYGIRTVSPLIIGSAKIKPTRFIIFNFFSGLCWAFVFCFTGYTIADVVMDGHFDSMPAFVAISVILAIVGALWTLFTVVRKR
ncbi:MAG: DedA family protein [Alphaproteobacteria bacterium]|nr:DedA family protein [Alphaproteobacteria bacterium]